MLLRSCILKGSEQKGLYQSWTQHSNDLLKILCLMNKKFLWKCFAVAVYHFTDECNRIKNCRSKQVYWFQTSKESEGEDTAFLKGHFSALCSFETLCKVRTDFISKVCMYPACYPHILVPKSVCKPKQPNSPHFALSLNKNAAICGYVQQVPIGFYLSEDRSQINF